MNKTILVTDSLFILPEHEKLINDAGYKIERLDKVKATEEELIQAIKGKVGYILGGIEQVTEKVIDAAPELKVIAFTGIGYKGFIPAWEYATKKGVVIVNAPDGPTHSVAEWAVTMALAMNRNIFELGRLGKKDFLTAKGIEGQHVGIIGLGRIGQNIIEMLKAFRPASISYYSRSRHEETEKSLNIEYKELNSVLSESDIVFACVSDDAGMDFINEKELAIMKNGALLVSFVHSGIINEEALLKQLETGRIRAVSDYPAKNEAFKNLPLDIWYCFNGSNAFNTKSGIKIVSDMCTQSILNILSTGEDTYRVN